VRTDRNKTPPQDTYPKETEPKTLETYLSWAQLRPLIGNQGRTTWWRAIRRGDAPAPVKVSPGRVAWRASEIRAWQAARVAECA
jgi:predicted DNA-binding transcriptional regulator AlpA